MVARVSRAANSRRWPRNATSLPSLPRISDKFVSCPFFNSTRPTRNDAPTIRGSRRRQQSDGPRSTKISAAPHHDSIPKHSTSDHYRSWILAFSHPKAVAEGESPAAQGNQEQGMEPRDILHHHLPPDWIHVHPDDCLAQLVPEIYAAVRGQDRAPA